MPAPALLNMFAAHTAAGGGGGLSAGAEFNIDFSDTGSLTVSGGKISAAADQTGNGWTFSQATSGNQPTTGSVTIGGLNAAGFSGSQWLDSSPIGTGGYQAQTIYLVIQSTDTRDKRILGTTGYFFGALINSAATPGYWTMFGGSELASTVQADTSAHVLVFTYNNTSSIITVDTTDTTGSDGGSRGPMRESEGFELGAAAGGTGGVTAAVGQLVGYFGAHDSTTRAANVSYLKSKWSTV